MYNFELKRNPQFGDWITTCANEDLEKHKYVRLEKLINWENLYSQMRTFYSPIGRPSKEVKAMILLLMVKHMENLSDAKLLAQLRDNVPLQAACNLDFKTAQSFIKDDSLFSKFRKRIGVEGCKLIEETVNAFVKGRKLIRDRTVIVDTTVVPSDIAYPTDIHLLEKARKYLLKIIKKYRAGVSYRTYARVAKKLFLEYIKLGRKSKVRTKKVHGRMLRFVKRNYGQALEAFERALKGGDAVAEREKQRVLEMLDTIATLLSQQDELRKKTKRDGSKRGIHIRDRIVSIFRSFVRPIPRGKLPVPTEFGAKVLFEMRSGFMRVLEIAYDNVPDAHMLRDCLEDYKGLTLAADRGFHKPANRRLAENCGVKNYFVERKGEKSLEKTSAVKRARGKRAAIEARISHLKNNHGLGRNLYGRGTAGEEQWIRFGVMGGNLNRALRLCA